MTMTMGQPGFFTPHKVNPWLIAAGAEAATSYYDNEPLRETLLELVDFDLINAKACRCSVGAVNVLSGNFIFFDNARHESGPSMSWPPAPCRRPFRP